MLEADYRVRFNPQYLKKHPSFEPAKVGEALLQGPWELAGLHSEFLIKGMGTTEHKAIPTAVSVGREKFAFFAKPFQKDYQADAELRATNVARNRGALVPPIIGVIYHGERAFLLSEIWHDFEPFAARRLDGKLLDPRIYTAKELVIDAVSAIGRLHDEGVLHLDLHLGNIGYRHSRTHPPRIAFCDFESAMMLDDTELRYKKVDHALATENMRQKFYQFEKEGVIDLSVFAANLKSAKIPLSNEELLNATIETYLKRHKSVGKLSKDALEKALSESFFKILRNLSLGSSNFTPCPEVDKLLYQPN